MLIFFIVVSVFGLHASELFEDLLMLDDFDGVFVGSEFVSRLVADGFGDDVTIVDWKCASVGAGDLQTVEHDGGPLGFDAVEAEGHDEHGERELDGLSIFQRGEVELERAASCGVVLGEKRFALELAGIEVERMDDVDCAVRGRIDGAVTVDEVAVPAAASLAAESAAAATGPVGEDVAAVFGHGELLKLVVGGWWLVVSGWWA